MTAEAARGLQVEKILQDSQGPETSEKPTNLMTILSFMN